MDAEWRLVAPLLPASKRAGRTRSWPLREVVNAISYVMRGEVAWWLLPSDLPRKNTDYLCFAAWRDFTGTAARHDKATEISSVVASCLAQNVVT